MIQPRVEQEGRKNKHDPATIKTNWVKKKRKKNTDASAIVKVGAGRTRAEELVKKNKSIKIKSEKRRNGIYAWSLTRIPKSD